LTRALRWRDDFQSHAPGQAPVSMKTAQNGNSIMVRRQVTPGICRPRRVSASIRDTPNPATLLSIVGTGETSLSTEKFQL
jgi:hypothetical protein